ncbi:hypothetical protein CSE45_2090 [Citreicella sp. SE45]|nr:hypothetical protein CSE45_2090 [Citreicella sp. SE45]
MVIQSNSLNSAIPRHPPALTGATRDHSGKAVVASTARIASALMAATARVAVSSVTGRARPNVATGGGVQGVTRLADGASA